VHKLAGGGECNCSVHCLDKMKSLLVVEYMICSECNDWLIT
jgi:hypothetical protein